MTYKDFIENVSREILDVDVWPTSASDKLSDQLNICYVAVLTIACEVPVQRLLKATSSLTLNEYQGSLKKADLPTDLFSQRPDLGLISLNVDGFNRAIDEVVSLSSLNTAASNAFQQDNKLFAISETEKSVYINGAVTASVDHVKDPAVPTSINYDGLDLPITGKDAQRAVQLVATHVSGGRARDNAAAQFSQLLNEIYKGGSYE